MKYVLFVCIAAAYLDFAAAQVDVNSFQDALARFEESRSRLVSFSAKVTVIDYREEKIDDFVNRSTKRSVHEVVADLTIPAMIVCRNDHMLQAKSSRRSSSGVFLRNKGGIFSSSGSSLIRDTDGRRREFFFDPQVIGVGFCAELRRFVAFEELLSNLRTWKASDWTKYEGDGETVTFGAKRGDSFYRKITFDKQKGWSPISVFMRDGSGISSTCEYEEFDGIWLPVLLKISCGNRNSMVVSVDWISVNQPFPEVLFDEREVARLSGLEVRQR